MTTQQKKNKFLEELLSEKLIENGVVLGCQLENKITEPFDYDSFCKAKISMYLIPPYMSYYDLVDIVSDRLKEQYKNYLINFEEQCKEYFEKKI